VPDIIYGKNPVTELLKTRPSHIVKIIVAKGKEEAPLKTLRALAKRHHIPITSEQRLMLDRLSGSAYHQGIVALTSPYEEVELEGIMEKWKSSKERLLLLILDGIQDPQNLGALIRSACACGVHGVITSKDRVVNIPRTLERLKEKGAWIVGTSAASNMSLYELDGTIDLALVIGSEGKGIRPLVKKKCDFLVQIPLRGQISSLNAAAAGAVALYEILRQRYYQKEKG
jgi:23S rRNA (guanosine2251-2'-O)-methyltransferase